MYEEVTYSQELYAPEYIQDRLTVKLGKLCTVKDHTLNSLRQTNMDVNMVRTTPPTLVHLFVQQCSRLKKEVLCLLMKV